ncbi:MAG TPA: thioredoxin family protein [Candidatus Methylomirabilis sp.]|nr:thioredoxin family protein [Candidatus Methylomirabilis sp.]
MTSTCATPRLDDASFEEKVLAPLLPVFVYFTERDCRDCDMARRIFGDVLGPLASRVECFCIHAATSPLLIARYCIAQLPTILLFRNGRVSRRLVGHPLPGQLETILRAEIPPPPPKT